MQSPAQENINIIASMFIKNRDITVSCHDEKHAMAWFHYIVCDLVLQ